MCYAFKTLAVAQKKFPSPNRPIGAVTGSIPGYAEHGRVEFIFGNAGQNVSPMMLNVDGLFTELTSVFGGEIIRVQIAGDQAGRSPVQMLQIRSNFLKSSEGLTRFEITNMLANKNLFADTQGNVVF